MTSYHPHQDPPRNAIEPYRQPVQPYPAGSAAPHIADPSAPRSVAPHAFHSQPPQAAGWQKQVYGAGPVSPYGPTVTYYAPALPLKDTTVAYLLAIFLGGYGAHNFYLGRTGAAVGQLVLWVLGLATSWLLIGLLPMFAVVIWLIVDLCTIPSTVRSINATRMQSVAASRPPY